MPGMVQQLRAAAEAGDWKKLTGLAQRIKPSLQAMNITALDNDMLQFDDVKPKSLDKAPFIECVEHVGEVLNEVVEHMRASQN